MLSVLILTLNEQKNIAECIASLPWQNDIYVLDSGSTDGTAEIALGLGAKVLSRTFDNYSGQRNYGLSFPFVNEWIVMLDADERMTSELAKEIERAITDATPGEVMMRVRRKDMFLGKWLKRSSGYPTWFARVLRRGHVQVARAVNEVYVADGTVRHLSGHLIHYPLNKGIEWWYERHNAYSTAEAELLLRNKFGKFSTTALFHSDKAQRRSALKALAYRLPARPFLMFIYLYVLRFGFIDGAAGYHFAKMRMAYELMIDTKVAYFRSETSASPSPS